jgi:hypothetical protein
LFCLEGKDPSDIADFFAPLITYFDDIEDLFNPKRINDALFEKIKQDNDLCGKGKLIEILNVLKSYKNEQKESVSFEYVILPAKNNFSTNINSEHTFIRFNDKADGYTTYNKLKTEFVSSDNQYEFFYLYSKEKVNSKHFLDYLYKEAHGYLEIRP